MLQPLPDDVRAHPCARIGALRERDELVQAGKEVDAGDQRPKHDRRRHVARTGGERGSKRVSMDHTSAHGLAASSAAAHKR